MEDKNIDFASVDKSNSISVTNIPNETITRNREMNFNLIRPGLVDEGIQVYSNSFPKETADVEVQVKSGDLRNSTSCDNIMSDDKLSTVTGIEKMEI